MALSLITLAVHVHCIAPSQSNDVFYDVFPSFHSHPIFFFFFVSLGGLAEDSDPDDVSRFCLGMNVIVTAFKLLKALCAGAIVSSGSITGERGGLLKMSFSLSQFSWQMTLFLVVHALDLYASSPW